LAEILIENPLCTLLVNQDELYALLKSLDKEGNEEKRGFFLQAYDGNQSYVIDRIMRGRNRRVEAVGFSMLGGIQPARLQSYVRDAINGGAGDDGLLQRFGMIVWPDLSKSWRNVDRWPNKEAKNVAFETIKSLYEITPDTDQNGEHQPLVYRFSEEAQEEFDAWREEFEIELRSGDLHPALESHFGKYRKLVPTLAVLCGMADGESTIGTRSLNRALGWYEYLRSHAVRVYSAGMIPSTEAASSLLRKIKSGAIENEFKARDIYLKGWSHLSTSEAVKAAASMLCDLNHLKAVESPPSTSGGRPTVIYLLNP